jgi:hypothetical protein
MSHRLSRPAARRTPAPRAATVPGLAYDGRAMQRRPDLVRALEDRFNVSDPLPPAQAFALFDAMWAEARELGVVPGDPWEGLDEDIRLTRIMAAWSPSS